MDQLITQHFDIFLSIIFDMENRIFNKITSSICNDFEVDVCCLDSALLSGAVEIVKQTCIRSIRVKDFEASKFKG